MSSMRDLAGRGWHEWPSFGDTDDFSISSSSPCHSSTDITPSSSRASTPPPNLVPNDDVMKLPRRDMHMFGHIPAQDEIVVGVCENCGLIVKIEALESHVRHRHGLPHGPGPTSTIASSRNSLSNSRGSSSSRGNVLKPIRVDLTKITAKLKQESRGSSKGSSLTSCPPPSRSKTPTPDKELVSPYVAQELSLDKHLPIVKVVSEPYLTKYDPDVDADITSSNVISIPDTEPLPHDMSGDLMAMVSEVSRGLEAGGLSQGSSLLGFQVALSNRPVIVSSPLNTFKPSPAKSRPKAAREYHPDQHCGVWDSEGRKQCTRALTCKSHSVLLKRKITGRSRPFDELLAAHKKAQAASVAPGNPITQIQTVTTITTSSTATVSVASPSTTVIRPQPPIHLPVAFPPKVVTGPPPQPLPILLPLPLPQAPPKEVDENFSHTNDHPKPLAVCTYNASRLGGLVFCGRNRTLAAKLVKLSFTNNSVAPAVMSSTLCRTAIPPAPSPATGFQRITPKLNTFQGENSTGSPSSSSSSSSPLTIVNGLKRRAGEHTLLINYNIAGKRACGVGAPVGVGNHGSSSPTVNLSTLQPGSSMIIPDSFQTDIQDFKGGIKFEYGSTIKLTQLKSGSDLG